MFIQVNSPSDAALTQAIRGWVRFTMPSSEQNRATSSEGSPSTSMHSTGVTGVEKVGRYWLEGQLRPVASVVWAAHDSSRMGMKQWSNFLSGIKPLYYGCSGSTNIFDLAADMSPFRLSFWPAHGSWESQIPVVTPRNSKCSIRLHGEWQPNVAGIREVIGIPFISHENEIVWLSRNGQDKRAL